MNIQIDFSRFNKDLKLEIEKNKWGVGILSKNRIKIPESKLKGYRNIDGMKARKIKKEGTRHLRILGKFLNKKYNFLGKPLTKEKEVKKIGENIIISIFEGKNINNELSRIWKDFIKNRRFGNNKKSTISKKGFDRPLFDTGTFYKNIKCKKVKNK